MTRLPLSGFCNPGHDQASHGRCTWGGADGRCACPCHFATPAGDPLTAVVDAVARLVDARDRLVDACTSPDATDLAEFLATVREARTSLYTEVEQVLEDACARAMPGDNAETPTLRVERYRGTDRKAWDHESWQRDVRAKVLRQHGLIGAQGILSADGEVLPPQVLHEVLRAVEAVHSSAGPKTGELRALGLDARDYCESSPGAYKVKVLRMADEAREDGAA